MDTTYNQPNGIVKIEKELPVTISNEKFNFELIEYFKLCFHEQELVDVTLTCEGQSLKAHKLIVGAGSVYLRRLIKDNPHPHPIILLNFIEFDILKAIIDFMYYGRIFIERNKLPNLLKIAQLLEVHSLLVGELTEADTLPGDQQIKEDQILQHVDDSLLLTTKIIARGLNEQKTKKNVHRLKKSIKKPRLLPNLNSIFSRNQAVAGYAIQGQSNSSHESPDVPQFDQIFVKEELVIDEKPEENYKPDDPPWLPAESDSTELSTDDDQSSASDGEDPDYKPTSSVPAKKIRQPTFYSQVVVGSRLPKLAFHEPRPCSICGNVYRDAATLRTHMSIMHTPGEMLFKCTCKQEFSTKYHMQVHKQKGHK